MGEAASLCDAAGLLAIFRSAVLKLDGDDNNSDSALLDVTDAAVESEQKEECVIFIDHMNDAPGYTKQLRKWSEQLGLDGGRLLHTTPAKPSSTRREHIICVLHGNPDATKAFLQRLRTQMVDVDRSGRPCKERQATVRWQKPLLRAPIEGWAVVECGAGDESVRAALANCGITEASQLGEIL